MKFSVALAAATLLVGCGRLDSRSRREKAQEFLTKNRTALESMVMTLLREPGQRCVGDISGRALCVHESDKGRYVSILLDGYDLQFVEPSTLRVHYERMASPGQAWCSAEGDIFELGNGWFGGHYRLDRSGSGVVRVRGPATPHGVNVRLDGPKGFSIEWQANRDGEFCIDWMPAGSYELRTHHPTGSRPYPATLLQAGIVVEEHKQTSLAIPQWPIPLPTAFVEVRVKFSDGTAAAGADLSTDIGMAVLKDRPTHVTALFGYSAWAVLIGRAGARRYAAIGSARSGLPLDLVLRSSADPSP